MLSHSRPWRPAPLPQPSLCRKASATHGAAGLNLGPFQGDGDAVEEDEGQDDIVEELVGDDGLTQDPEPGRGGQEARQVSVCPSPWPPLQLEQPQAQAAVGRTRVPALARARRRRRRPGLRGCPGRRTAAGRAPACPARPPRASWSPPGAPSPPPPPDAVPRHQRLSGSGRAGARRGHPPPGSLEGGGPDSGP